MDCRPAGDGTHGLQEKEEQAWFLVQIGWLRGPKARGIVEAMAAGSKVKKAARAWLDARPV